MTAEYARRLAGQVAIITGASRRIGRATALRLAEEGAHLVLNARSARDEVEGVAEEVRAAGGRALVQMADITDEDAIQGMVDAAMAEYGRIDILVNNAAIRKGAPMTEMTLGQWREIMAVILDGSFLCSRAVLPHMVEAGTGTIVNIGGVTGHTGCIGRAHVATAKAALVGLTKCIAVEFADKGITANCVVPGKIGGPRSATAGEAPPVPGEHILVGRMGTVEEVAEAICFVCLPTGRFITGQSIHVSGGLYLP
ncbi:MAG TPA: SDR family oxidoreductase [Kiloniellales bacterium]|nr:SDR family oxidoreductase [Kiloniellales bacterium]